MDLPRKGAHRLKIGLFRPSCTRLLGNPENGSWNSIQDMKDKGLRGKKSLIRIALERLYYARIIEKIVRKRKIYWRIRSHIVDRSDVLPNTDSGKFDGAA